MAQHDAPPPISQALSDFNQPLRSRVDAVEEANQRALETAERERDRAAEALKELLYAKIEAADEKANERIDALKELIDQYQRLRHDQDVTAEKEREKAASALREALIHQTRTGDENLRQHIDHQREQVDAAFQASEKAIAKKEAADEKRLETVLKTEQQLHDSMEKLLPRELFDSTTRELRERGATNLDLIQGLALRMTEMEARGGGEKDHAAELRATLALGVATVSGIAAVAAALIALFAN